MNQIFCGACKRPKFVGLFTQAQKKIKTDGSRRCMACQGKESRACKRKFSRINGVGKGNAWRRGGAAALFLPNTHL